MRRSIVTAIAIGFLTFMSLANQTQAQTPNQSAEPQVASLKQVFAELKQLRLALLQQAIEFQQWKIQQLERELQPIQSELQRWREQEQSFKEHLAELERQSGNTTPAPETAELEALKVAFKEKELKQLSTKQQQVAELTEQLERERQRLQELASKAEQLRAEG